MHKEETHATALKISASNINNLLNGSRRLQVEEAEDLQDFYSGDVLSIPRGRIESAASTFIKLSEVFLTRNETTAELRREVLKDVGDKLLTASHRYVEIHPWPAVKLFSRALRMSPLILGKPTALRFLAKLSLGQAGTHALRSVLASSRNSQVGRASHLRGKTDVRASD